MTTSLTNSDSDLNDINFFVEDKNKEYEYETIFSRLFKGKYKICSIISANGKKGVEQAFWEFGEIDKNNSKRYNFYIVDGDFDKYIHEKDIVENQHYFYLDRYNIENYFIDEKAVLEFAKGKLHLLDKMVQSKINFTYWKETITEQATRLFLLYCTVQRVLPTEKNVSRNEYLFIDDKTGFEKENGYKEYYDLIIEKNHDIDSEIEKIKVICEQINDNYCSEFICGKFLLTSLFVYLKNKTKNNFTKDELRWMLICNFDVSSLNFIKKRVDAICRKGSSNSLQLI